jgi:RNA recognition motif-containing protein
MNNKLFVGNLAFSLTEDALRDTFSAVGGVASVKLVTDRETGRARGFGFVEMDSDDLATQAIEQLNGKDVGGREISVSVAKPQTRSNDRGFGGGNARRW